MLPNAWVTHVAGLLSGDNVCLFSPWIRARQKFTDGKDFTEWKIKHTALVQRETDKLTEDGWIVRLENENYWRLRGETAILSGKPDIVAEKGGRFRIVDAKSGEAEDKHRIQVAVYLVAIPMSWKRTLNIHGVVAYPDHSVYVEPHEADHVRPALFALMRQIGSTDVPIARPSWKECRFCPVPKSACAVKVETEPAEVAVTEF